MPFSALRDDYSVDGSEEIDLIFIVKLAKSFFCKTIMFPRPNSLT